MAAEKQPLVWTERGGRPYARDAYEIWDGDEDGVERPLGYLVYAIGPQGAAYEVYEDDGRGNGDFVGSGATLDEAKAIAQAHCDDRALRWGLS